MLHVFDVASSLSVVGITLFALVNEIVSRLESSYSDLIAALKRAHEAYKELTGTEFILRHPVGEGTVILFQSGFSIPAWSRVLPDNGRRYFRQRPFWPWHRVGFQRGFPPSLRTPLRIPLNARIQRAVKSIREDWRNAEQKRTAPYDRKTDLRFAIVALGCEALEILGRARWLHRAYAATLALALIGGLTALVAALLRA